LLTSTLAVMRLTRIERNQVFEAIAQSNLDPGECVYEEREGYDAVRHESGSTLEIKTISFTASIRRYELYGHVVDGKKFPKIGSPNIEQGKPYIKEWAEEVRLVVGTPDLWAEMRRSRELIADIQRADSGNMPFTQDEREQIVLELEKVKEQVKERFDLTDVQLAYINERLDEAAEATERMGRKDWRLLFGGTILNLIVTDTITPGVAGHIFNVVINGLAHLFGAGPAQILG
jgi:hypothetical protein